ncbi:MAG: hypothetical protein WAT79_08845 [Saprospiraceae bacterium]
METARHEFTDRHRVSKIIKTSDPKEWSPDRGKTLWIVEITFENGDIIKAFEDTLPQALQYCVGQKYIYQMNIVTTLYDDKEAKTSRKFAFKRQCLPDSVESRLNRVTEVHQYIKRSAELAVQSMQGDVWTDSDFKDRYKLIYDTMKTTLYEEDFGEMEGDDFDTFLKKNESILN